MRKLVYYVAASLDGFIADEAGQTTAFPVQPETLADLFARYPETCPHHLRQPLDITAAACRFDTVIMGYGTHEPALLAGLTSAYPHLRQIVATHRALPSDPTVETWAGTWLRGSPNSRGRRAAPSGCAGAERSPASSSIRSMSCRSS